MSLTYRTKRRLHHLGTIALIVLMAIILIWFCWVVWLERYVVYSRDGATLDFEVSNEKLSGQVARPPAAGTEVDIYFNEGDNVVDTKEELTQLKGYYISAKAMTQEFAAIRAKLDLLEPGTAVMIELKPGNGTFLYSSSLAEAVQSTNIDVTLVDELIQACKGRNLYTIARVSAFRDYYYGLNHVPNGLYHINRKGLWPDSGNCYWLNPTSNSVLNWITSVILEVKGLGFDEVLLADFRFPDTDKIIFNDDKDLALQKAANTIFTSCATDSFAVSFLTASASFPLPEGRCRLYLENVAAQNVGLSGSQASFADPEIRLVFLADTQDTRFEQYGVLRPLETADLVKPEM